MPRARCGFESMAGDSVECCREPVSPDPRCKRVRNVHLLRCERPTVRNRIFRKYFPALPRKQRWTITEYCQPFLKNSMRGIEHLYRRTCTSYEETPRSNTLHFGTSSVENGVCVATRLFRSRLCCDILQTISECHSKGGPQSDH